jgi:hypothetical protein
MCVGEEGREWAVGLVVELSVVAEELGSCQANFEAECSLTAGGACAASLDAA